MQAMNPVCGAGGYTTADVGSGTNENPEPKASAGQIGPSVVREISIPRHIKPPSVGGAPVVMIGQRSPNSIAPQEGGIDLQLLPNHTFQPYFWISPFASEKIVAGASQFAEQQTQVVAELAMSESVARQHFHERFEYRLVNYGYTCTATHSDDKQVRNYGLFAKVPAKRGEVLGIYSGVAYLLRHTDWIDVNSEEVYAAFKREMPDFMSCYRALYASTRGNPLNQRIASKYGMSEDSADERYFIYITPDNNRFTPMHFINSANVLNDVNVAPSLVSVTAAGAQFVVPAIVAIRNIQVGEEMLASYLMSPCGHPEESITKSAADKKLEYDKSMRKQINMVRLVNSFAEDKPPISTFVAAPMIYVSEMVSKWQRKSWGKTSRR